MNANYSSYIGITKNFTAIASRCEEKKKSVLITRKGFSAFVLMSIDANEQQQTLLARY